MVKAKYSTLEETVRNLKIGDLILVHWQESLLSKIIRQSTASYWEHVAVVFDVPHEIDEGVSLDEILIVETSPSSSLTLHRLQNYLRQSKHVELGFKRVPGLNDVERERFRGFFLESLGTPYDLLRVIMMFLEIAITWALNVNISFEHASRMIRTRRYICTSLAQRAFYLAASPRKRPSMMFRGHEENEDFISKMEQIAPGDIAKSKNTVWLYNPHE